MDQKKNVHVAHLWVFDIRLPGSDSVCPFCPVALPEHIPSLECDFPPIHLLFDCQAGGTLFYCSLDSVGGSQSTLVYCLSLLHACGIGPLAVVFWPLAMGPGNDCALPFSFFSPLPVDFFPPVPKKFPALSVDAFDALSALDAPWNVS